MQTLQESSAATAPLKTPDNPMGLSQPQRRAITGGVMLAMFLAALDGTVVSTAMPTVIAQLGGFEIYSWVFSSFMLTSTVSVPLWGRLSDLYGRKRFYLAAIVVFVAGSMLAGQSNSMAMLIVTRALQGLGAGGLFTLSITIIGEIYSLEQRVRMQAVFSSVWGLASIVGPLVGGFFTDVISWRWVFYVNFPFGVAAAAVIFWMFHEQRSEQAQARIDYVGALALTGSMTLLLLGLLKGSQAGWLAPEVLAMLISSAGLLAAFVLWERRFPQPILPLALFGHRIFTASAISGLFVGMAMFGTISYLPLFVQGVMGGSATQAGSSLMPFTLGWVIFSTVGGRVLLRLGYRPTVFIGMGVMLLGFLTFTALSASVSWALVLLAVGLAGSGMGMVVVSLLLAVQNSVPRNQLGIATSSSIFARSIGGTIGVSILGTVLSLGMQYATAHVSPQALTPTQAQEAVALAKHPEVLISGAAQGVSAEAADWARQALDGALHNVFLLGLLFVVFALSAAFLIPKGKAQEHMHASRT